MQIIVVDNSEEEYTKVNQHLLENCNSIRYICNHGNLGLSKGYNKAINSIEDDCYWVMLSDDDTEFGMDYLRNVCDSLETTKANIITGCIKVSDGTSISPVTSNSIINRNKKPITIPGVYENIYCINSGLAIKSDVFNAIGLFSEDLFLDMIDFWFMDTLIKYNLNRIEVLDGTIYQSFSGNETFNDYSMKRYEIYKRDFNEYCKLTNKPITYKIILIKRRIRLALLRMRRK